MMNINVHEVLSVGARLSARGNWIDLKIKSATDTAEISLFFESAETARAYADAINAVKPAVVGQQDAA